MIDDSIAGKICYFKCTLSNFAYSDSLSLFSGAGRDIVQMHTNNTNTINNKANKSNLGPLPQKEKLDQGFLK